MNNKWTRQQWFQFQRNEFEQIIKLTQLKNEDYTNNSEPFANFDGAEEFGVDPIVGLAIRMADKFQRLKSFSKSGKLSVQTNGDTISDIFRDLIGYSSLALGMIQRNKETTNDK